MNLVSLTGLEKGLSLKERIELLRKPFEYEFPNVGVLDEYSFGMEWPSYKRWLLPDYSNVAKVSVEKVQLDIYETSSCVYSVSVRDYFGEIEACAITPIPAQIHTLINNRRYRGIEYNPKIDQPLIDEWIEIWDGRIGADSFTFPLFDRIGRVQYYSPTKETQILIAHTEGMQSFGTYDVELMYHIGTNKFHLIDADPSDDEKKLVKVPIKPSALSMA